MAYNGLSTTARVTFNMYSDSQTVNFNIDSRATGSNQIAGVIDVPLNSFVYLPTASLTDIRWAAFINEGSGSNNGKLAIRVSGSSSDITYLPKRYDGSLISMQSGSLPNLIALAFTSGSILNYKLQES